MLTCQRCGITNKHVGAWKDAKNPQWSQLCPSCKSVLTVKAIGARMQGEFQKQGINIQFKIDDPLDRN